MRTPESQKGLLRVRFRLTFPRSGHIRHEKTVLKSRREMMILHRPSFQFQLILPAKKSHYCKNYQMQSQHALGVLIQLLKLSIVIQPLFFIKYQC